MFRDKIERNKTNREKDKKKNQSREQVPYLIYIKKQNQMERDENRKKIKKNSKK